MGEQGDGGGAYLCVHLAQKPILGPNQSSIKQIAVPPPDAAARLHILHALLPHTTTSDDDGSSSSVAWLSSVARDCVGYVAADLQALVREALMAQTLADSHSTVLPVLLTEAALRGAMERVGASVLRGKGLEAPHVPWTAIGTVTCVV